MSGGTVPDPSSSASYDAYQLHLQRAVLATTKLSHSLPQPSDISFHRSLERRFAEEIDGTSDRLLELVNGVLGLVKDAKKKSEGKDGTRWKGKGKVSSRAEDDAVFKTEEDVVDGYSAASDLVDWLLERTDDTLDILSGRKALSDAALAAVAPRAKRPEPVKGGQGPLPNWILNDKTLRKPQRQWKVDNRRGTVWLPLMSEGKKLKKLHALDGNDAIVRQVVELPDELDEDGQILRGVPHPYRLEIETLGSLRLESDSIYSAPSDLPELGSPDDSFASRPFTFIDSAKSLSGLITHLRTSGLGGSKVQEIALDLEHHDLRTYQGLTSLLQLSSRSQDFVIDVLVPEVRTSLWKLNEFLCDPRIIKVLHGAESDVLWLQRDLQLYLVNLFDTFHAVSVLNFPKKSLAALLEHYTGFRADKRYQMADWRIRPLPEEMLHYARSDTHFLLDVYDRLKAALLALVERHAQWTMTSGGGPRAAMNEVLRRSNDTALRRWEAKTYDWDEGYGPEGWRGLVVKWGKSFEWGVEVVGPDGGKGRGAGRGVAFEVFRAVHDWRDRIARDEDESPRYVLPNQLIFKLADRVPTTASAVMACCSPVPPLVHSHAAALAQVIADTAEAARARGAPEASATPLPTVQAKSVKELAGECKVDPMPALWTADPSIAAASSVKSLAASTSALFGQEPVSRTSAQARVRQTLAKLGNVLSFAVAVPPPAHGTSTPESSDGPSDGEPLPAAPAPKPSADHVFVPKAQRAKDEDDVVIVSKMKDAPKKRKRVKNEPATPSNKPKKVTAADVKPFDYTGQPTVLDSPGPSQGVKSEGEPKKRKKHGHGAAPRKMTEPKSGNLSMRFS